MNRRSLLLSGLTLVLLALLVFEHLPARAGSVVLSEDTHPLESGDDASTGLDGLGRPRPGDREGVSVAGGADRPAGEPQPLDEEGLRAALRAIAAVDLRDEEALEEALFDVVASRPPLDRTVQLLQGGGLTRDGERFSPEEIGALRAVLCAAALFCAPSRATELHRSGHARDGRAFVEDLLRALVNMFSPVRETLANLLASLRGADDRLVLDLSYERLLRELAQEHPEQADLYLGILAELGTDLEGVEARALDLFELERAESPRLLTVSLTRLLRGARGEQALQWAGELYDRDDTSEDLREAISSSVATAAPVAEAAAFLADRATSAMFAEMFTLGDRAGGREALEDAYYERRIAGVQEEARRLLVAGLEDAGPEALLAIASEDPSARVRGQAVLTLTASSKVAVEPATLTFLRQGYEDRADPRIGLPESSVVYATANLVRSDLAPELRDATVQFLRELTCDGSLDVPLRRHALEALAGRLDPAEHVALAQALGL